MKDYALASGKKLNNKSAAIEIQAQRVPYYFLGKY